jgi:hypothetical protein
VRGHSAVKNRTFPYQASRVGSLWVMRDAPRRNPRDYRKEEWIAHDADALEVDAMARRKTRGRFLVCAIVGEGESNEPTRSAYKSPQHVPAKWNPVRRQGHASSEESTAFPVHMGSLECPI